MTRSLTYAQAINEATAECMTADDRVYIVGLGVPGPTGVFGTTTDLEKRFGSRRVYDMPSSENAMTGVILGTGLTGLRPILVHSRVDFAVLSVEPLVNQVAKWHYMYGGKMKAPLTVRMIVGRGWGQGPQHSQSLQAWFAHVPGLKVVMPTTPYDVKGMLIAAVEDDAPVIVLEHRWLYNISGEVPDGRYTVPLDRARLARAGGDITIAATSYMTLEALRAADMLSEAGVEAEVLDLRSLSPIDSGALLDSVRKTGNLIVADTGHTRFGVGAEVLSCAVEGALAALKSAPQRIGLPHVPTPTSPALSDHFYPRAANIAQLALDMLGSTQTLSSSHSDEDGWHDQPDPSFTGPY